MGKKSVYIETTVPSLVTARPCKNKIDALHQYISQQFWENERHKYDLYISEYVYSECSDGDTEAAKRRIDLIKDIPRLPVTPEAEILAEEYFEFLDIPRRAKTDCFHLAVCVVNKIDFLISWNMTHLGRPNYLKIASFNIKRNLWLPELLTPDVLMDIEREEKQNEKI